jgi:hypothetical protein
MEKGGEGEHLLGRTALISRNTVVWEFPASCCVGEWVTAASCDGREWPAVDVADTQEILIYLATL